MKTGFFRLVTLSSVLTMAACLAPIALWGQSGNQGTIVVTAQDSSGAVIPGANLELVELSSNSIRKAETGDKGTYTFVNLSIGVYRLTVGHAGYQTKIYDSVVVESSTTNTLVASLAVGAVTETVRVTTEETAVLQTSSSEIGTVINTTEIENLPIQGRSLAALPQLAAGFNGTYNGLPTPDQGNNIDGGISSSSRGKYGGSTSPAVQPRIESFEQVSTVTDGLSLGNGFGQASTQLNFISRRGSNQFHGRIYDDFRNSGLNANSYANNASGVRRAKLILNDYGVSVGGPILHDKLFFFGTYAASRQPGTINATNNVFTSSAQQGNFSYNGHTVNVFQLAHSYNPTLPGTVNSTIASQQTAINTAVGTQGLTTTGDPNLLLLTYSAPGGINYYFPVGRLDYNLSDKLRMYLSFLFTQETSVGAYPQPFPGAGFSNQNGNYFFRNYQANYGLDYIISPKVVNQFKFSFLYDYTTFVSGTAKYWETHDVISWQYPGAANGDMSGANPALPTGQFYPLFSLSDNVTYQHGTHALNFGFQGYREQDHYYNPPVGFNIIPLGISSGDPVANAFTISGSNPTMPGATSTNQTAAEQLYAVLTGRIQNVNGSYAYNTQTGNYNTGSHAGYNLDELALATGIWAQDTWKATPALTLTYGLRWDFTTPTHDISNAYHNSNQANVWGPTGVGSLFQPGTLNGVANPVLQLNPNPYHGWYKSPQPQVGLAWNPMVNSDGFLKKLLGVNSTVIRAGFGLRNFTEPYQFFWDEASDYGSFFYQFFNLTANTSGQPGTFAPGSLSLGNTLPAFAVSPATFQATAPQSEFTWVGGSNGTPVSGMDPNIRQPYSESWNFGIQRALGRTTVLEARYNGNRTVHQWMQINPNETNIFENGFLAEFKKAQANLALGGGKTFSDVNSPNKTPIMDAAFGGAGTANFSATQFINYLVNGQVGTFANQLAGNNANTPSYFCHLVGTNLAPCATAGGYTGSGAGYPINFFQANGYQPGRGTNWMMDGGYSNYNALQVDLRQASWHGLQGDLNYVWSKSLGLSTANGNYTAAGASIYTLRNLGLSYTPTSFDIRQVTHAYGTYDLPFGKGRAFLSNRGNLVNSLAGGFSLGTVITFQTGAPFLLTGGYATYNASGDGGVVLGAGVTPSQLQSAVGVHRVPGSTSANLLDPKYLSTQNTANYSLLAPNTTPGTIANIIFLHGPTAFTQNLAVTKLIPIKERLMFNMQGEFINVWNHPVFGNTFGSTTASLQSTSFSRAGVTNSPRAIELRANFIF